jgi:hypothetical protein
VALGATRFLVGHLKSPEDFTGELTEKTGGAEALRTGKGEE